MAEGEHSFRGKVVGALIRLWFVVLDSIFPRSRPLIAFESLTLSGLAASSRPVTIGGYCTSLLHYSDSRVRAAIWELKYRGRRAIARRFAALLYEHIVDEAAEDTAFGSGGASIIVPIPMTPSNQRLRGFNQVELLLEEIIALDSIRTIESGAGILEKSRETRRQTGLHRKFDRARNVRGSFVVKNTHRIRGRSVIILDDVVTTGSTLDEARAALLQAGARSVTALTIAH